MDNPDLKKMRLDNINLYDNALFDDYTNYTAHIDFEKTRDKVINKLYSNDIVRCFHCGHDVELAHHKYMECDSCGGLYLLKGTAVYTDVKTLKFRVEREYTEYSQNYVHNDRGIQRRVYRPPTIRPYLQDHSDSVIKVVIVVFFIVAIFISSL